MSNWLIRLLGEERAPEPPQSPAHEIRCECGSDQPMFSLCLLRSFRIENGKLVAEVTGERVSCQSCGNVFSIGPHGRFKQHAQALPYSPNGVPQTSQRAAGPDPANPPIPERPPTLRIPLERPTI